MIKTLTLDEIKNSRIGIGSVWLSSTTLIKSRIVYDVEPSKKYIRFQHYILENNYKSKSGWLLTQKEIQEFIETGSCGNLHVL